jgi:hypothetical protein
MFALMTAITKPSNVRVYTALIGAVVIALGLIPVPLTNADLPRATWFEYTFSLLPLLPLLILTLGALSGRSLPVKLSLILTSIAIIVGGLLTLFLAAFSGAGTLLVTLYGFALTTAVSTSIILASACGPMVLKCASVLFFAPACVGLWSLMMVPVAYADASRIAATRPYCVASHSPIQKELLSLIGLRGFSFYTTSSGYKLGDTWYFHGLLIVEDGDDVEVYNWSPRRMNFDRLTTPQNLFVSPLKACETRSEFLEDLALF